MDVGENCVPKMETTLSASSLAEDHAPPTTSTRVLGRVMADGSQAGQDLPRAAPTITICRGSARTPGTHDQQYQGHSCLTWILHNSPVTLAGMIATVSHTEDLERLYFA